MTQVAWVLDHQRDLWADFRAFYHLSPAEALALPSPEYFALAYRASAFAGVMAARFSATSEPSRPGARQVEGTREAIGRDPLLADVIEFG